VANKTLVVLKRRSDFLKIRKLGKGAHGSAGIVLNFRKTDLGHLRCGWTIPKKIGTAVTRNRLRRWCREFFRPIGKQAAPPSVDVNIVFLQGKGIDFGKISFAKFTAHLAGAWERAQKGV